MVSPGNAECPVLLQIEHQSKAGKREGKVSYQWYADHKRHSLGTRRITSTTTGRKLAHLVCTPQLVGTI